MFYFNIYFCVFIWWKSWIFSIHFSSLLIVQKSLYYVYMAIIIKVKISYAADNIFGKHNTYIFRILWIDFKFKKIYFCNTFDQFNASLVNKSINICQINSTFLHYFTVIFFFITPILFKNRPKHRHAHINNNKLFFQPCSFMLHVDSLRLYVFLAEMTFAYYGPWHWFQRANYIINKSASLLHPLD